MLTEPKLAVKFSLLKMGNNKTKLTIYRPFTSIGLGAEGLVSHISAETTKMGK